MKNSNTGPCVATTMSTNTSSSDDSNLVSITYNGRSSHQRAVSPNDLSGARLRPTRERRRDGVRKPRDPLIVGPGSEHGSYSSPSRRGQEEKEEAFRTSLSSSIESSTAVVASSSSPPPTTTTEEESNRCLEIFPGFSARLRGASETWRAIEGGNYLPVTCLTCTLDLCCIMDADFVVCPCCQGITPVSEENTATGHNGVGLGISSDDVNQKFHESWENRSLDGNEVVTETAVVPVSRGIGQVSLFDIFPRHVAEALRDGRKVEAEEKEEVTIFFCDIVGFTDISSTLDPRKIANLLDRLYYKFDELSHKHDCYKVETIGDAYMAVTNLVKDQPMDHVKRIAQFARDAVAAANDTPIDPDDPSKGHVQIRAGFHVGSVVADVVGNRNPRYCLFGDTVNVASRMESNSAVNRINCSELAANLLLAQWPDAILEDRGEVFVKGKGLLRCFWVMNY